MISTPIYSPGDRWFGRINTALLVVFALCALYPIVYVTSLSVSSGDAATSGRVWLWPVEWTLSAHAHVLQDKLFWTSYANTFVLHRGRHADQPGVDHPGGLCTVQATPDGAALDRLFRRLHDVVQRRHDPVLPQPR